MIRMNLATPLAFRIEPPDPIEQNPIAILFECIEKRFGATCAQLNVKRNTIIFTQGAKLTSLYLIKQGEILLTRVSQDGRETLLSILGPGEFFGESSLLSGTAITFSANATKRSELLQLPMRKFKLLLEDPWACRVMLESIARRCDDAWTQMEVLGCTHVRDKVRSGLIWLSEKIGVETHEGVRIDLNQTQFARMVGCARETLSREVNELKRLHTVNVHSSNGRRALFVVNPKGLN
jgi:CRP/FNR family transcriptional regulator, cyclic AMP receptor protein